MNFMINRLNKLLVLASMIVVASIISSCKKDFLSVVPKGQLVPAATNDYGQLLEDSRFPYFGGKAGFFIANYFMGDDVAAMSPLLYNSDFYTSQFAITAYNNMFKWADETYDPADIGSEVSGIYNNLYTVNVIINGALSAKGGSNAINMQYHAEGLANRAFYYFYLVDLFGKPYNAATAATDLGMPIVTKADINQKSFTRATVQQCYDFMIADLTAAIPNLPLTQTDANRFTKAAAEALLGKIYVWMGNFTLAATVLDQAVTDLPAKFSTSGVLHLVNYNTATYNPQPFFSYIYTDADDISAAGQLSGYPETLLARVPLNGYTAGNLCLAPATFALYGNEDLRINLYTATYSPLYPGPKDSLPYALRIGNIATGFGNSVGIQLPDIYLLRAEAKARTGSLAAATADLVTLRQNRMPADAVNTGIPTLQADLVKFIINERQREFAMCGYRWQDMRRLSNDPLFANASYTHTIYDQNGLAAPQIFTLTPVRFTLRLPKAYLATNPGMQDNP